MVSRIQFHIEKIKEICTEICDIKKKHKDERHKEDEYNKTTSPEVKLRTTYKYKAESKDIHDQHAQGYIYSRNRKGNHQKPPDNKKNRCHVNGEYPTQRF
jgi:hypothetical protein